MRIWQEISSANRSAGGPCDALDAVWHRSTAGAVVASFAGALWRLARELAADFQMTAFDLPGHGRSADWDGMSDYQFLSTQIAGNFITNPIDVIGHSFGATVALRLAVEQPEKVRYLTLIELVFCAVAGQDVHASLVAPQPYRDALQAA